MSRSGQVPNLEKIFKDNKEEDFTPFGGSNLAAIFDTSLKLNDTNSSLKPFVKNTASGDKKQIQHPPSSSSKTEIIVAKVVYAYKLQNGQYSLVGKLGIALIGNVITNTYNLILYRNNKEHISVAKLTFNFIYSVHENNYATYYDCKNDNWSILFENTEDCIELGREIGISKYFLKVDKSDENIFYQDLTASVEGEEAKKNDKVSIRYSIITSIIQPLKISTASVRSSEVEITTDNNWEKCLLGTRKNLTRILFLSPSRQISLGPGFPRDKDIALEIEIVDIIPSETVRIPSPNAITSSGKASLISRIAKMGQSILPKLLSSTATDSEDTEEEVHIKSPRRIRNTELSEVKKKSTLSNKPILSIEQNIEIPAQAGYAQAILRERNIIPTSSINNPHETVVTTVPFSNVWGSAAIPQQYFSTTDGQLYPIQPTLTQSITTPVDPNMNVFLSESRTHNAEIRIGMSKIAHNVQKILDKFHTIEMQNIASSNNEKTFEAFLKTLLASKNETLSNEKIEMDKNPIINGSSVVQTSEKQKQLEDDLNSTKNSLNERSSRLEILTIEERKINCEKWDSEVKLQNLERLLSDMQNEFQKIVTDLKNSNDTVMQYQKDSVIMKAKLINLNAKIKVLEHAVTSNRNTLVNQNDKAADIKEIMNKTYQTLITKFTEDSYTADYIKTTVAKTIKAITLQVLGENKSHLEDVLDLKLLM